MRTAIQELIHFIENDRMQSSYTKEQLLELLTFKLEKEKEQIKDSFVECWKSNVPHGIECKLDAEEYYNTTFK